MKKLAISLLIASSILGAHQSALGMQIGPSQEATIFTNFSDFEQYMSTHHPEIKTNKSNQLIQFAKKILHSNHELAIMALECCAQKGNANALIELGILFNKGIPGIMLSNRNLAIYWFTKAATERGNANAMIELGILSNKGIPGIIPRNPNLAIYWFTRAATERGNANAMLHLGILYRDGIMAPNKDKAVYWFTRATQKGNTDAMIHLGILYRDGIPEIINPDKDEAVYWFTRATQKGDSDAKTHLEDIELERLWNLLLPPDTRWSDVSDFDEKQQHYNSCKTCPTSSSTAS